MGTVGGVDGPDRDVEIRRLVAAHLPGYQVAAVAPAGAGLDNVAYEVNGELIVRFSKSADAGRVGREARLLAAVAEVSPLPVPRPVFTDLGHGCVAYRKVPGAPLLDLPRSAWSAHAAPIAATLGGFLTALHAVPVDRMAGLVDVDDQPLAEWRRDAAGLYATVAGRVPAAHRPAVEAFLASPPPDSGHPLVFSHNDLGIEHVLVDPAGWTVTGVIDWGDAAIVDPAYDVGLLYRDLGPPALDAYPDGVERAVFYARCSVFEDLAYGLETGQERYLDKSVAAMAWLFPV
jgi:aminoglycoside phosphotransferase (APT) family kinase protein